LLASLLAGWLDGCLVMWAPDLLGQLNGGQ
jgi:hypothetical protein